MADDSLDDKVAMFSGATGLAPDTCRTYLQKCNGNLEQAVNRWYDQGADGFKDVQVNEEGWDPNAWGTDRYGQQTDSNVPTFQIDYAPGVENYPHSGAPSRPPSRTSHHSRASNMDDAPLPSIENNGQELGVVGGSSGSFFGPANRTHYDTNQWALVPTSSSTEFVPDVPPDQRKREEGAPAFIKPLPNGDYLPAMLTIFQSIPIYRNAFLAPSRILTKYDANEEWWKGGETTTSPTIVSGDGSGHDGQRELDFIHELQRLIAFLDSTDRAYGSVETLKHLDAYTKARLPEGEFPDFHKVLMIWGDCYQKQMPNAVLNGSLRSVVNVGGLNRESWYLDAMAIHRDASKKMTLYDVLDDHLHSSILEHAYIVDIPKVLVFRLERSDKTAKSLNVAIPSTFYADRYLQENAERMTSVISDVKQYEEQIRKIEMDESKVKYHTIKGSGQKVEALKLLKTSMKAFEPAENDLIENPKHAAVLTQLQTVYSNIEKKLSVLDQQKASIRKLLDEKSGIFKGPVEDPEDPAKDLPPNQDSRDPESEEAYHLLGVSTRHNVFYILYPDIQSDVLNATQWWRIEYVYSGTDPYITREKVTSRFVLKQASQENNEVFLVYANTGAFSEAPIPLPEPLQKFVHEDNMHFFEELQSATQGVPVVGDWDKQPPSYDDYDDSYNQSYPSDDFEHISAAEWHASRQQQSHYPSFSSNDHDSGFSSTTLTPNTEMGDQGTEMAEINGGRGSLLNAISSASSETVVGESEGMDVVRSDGAGAAEHIEDLGVTPTTTSTMTKTKKEG